MERWITRLVGGKEVLRVREGEQFEWADVIYPTDWIGNHTDDELAALGFTLDYRAVEVPPEPGRPVIVSRLQFFRALAKRGLISQPEALAAVTVNAIPAALQAAVDELPEAERFDAEIIVAGAAEFDSSHPLTIRLGSGLMSPDQIADFFAFAKSL